MLGRIDAIAAFSEISVRELRANVTDSDLSKHLRALAARHRINITHVDLELLPLRSTQLQVVSVHQVFMKFLVTFKQEHPLGSSWEPRVAQEPMVKYVWKHTVGTNSVGTEEKIELELAEYYRYARNRFVHDTLMKQPKLEKLKAAVKTHTALRKLDGPNPYRSLRFDDIVIFARSVLGVASTLCRNSMPTETEVISMVRRLDGLPMPAGMPSVKLRNYRKFKNNQLRLHQKLATLLRSLYGIDSSVSGNIVQSLASGLLA
jgi:hypothetical protein